SSGPEGAPPDLADRVMNRTDRQRVLYEKGKRFRFVIPEAVLRWPYGPPGDAVVLDEHREQLARVEWASRRPNVEVGILPLAPVAVWRTAGFVIFDEVEDGEPLVHLEMLTPLLRDTLRLCELIVGMESHLVDSVKQLEQRVDALADQIRANREE